MVTESQFFPAIGQLAQSADASSGNALDNGTQDDDRPLEEVQSLCMQCGEQGITRMMLTSIPYFKEVIVISFRCERCGATNNEIQSAGTIKAEGVLYTLKVLHHADLDRQIVRSEACTVEIPDFELQLPPARGQLTTVEGLLRDIVADLSSDQPVRRILDEAAYTKIQQIIDGIKGVLGDEEEVEDEAGETGQVSAAAEKNKDDPVKKAITIKLDDPSGNSFVEFFGSISDPKWTFKTYARNAEQNRALGLIPPEEDSTEREGASEADGEGAQGTNEEIYEFTGVCSRCARPLVTRMKNVSIPYFKDTLIMSTNCENCGYRDNEVKSGAAISEKGKRITLRIEDREDLSRDILKSETCGLTIPEIDLALQPGTLGGRFTTVEGILEQVYEELSAKVYTAGDSSTMVDEDRQKFQHFLKQLKEVRYPYHHWAREYDVLFAQITNAQKPFTLILDDPLANSYLQNLYAPDPDPNMEIVTYERTWQQNEELGLNDMKVENYTADDANETKEEKRIEEVAS
ncbi:zf-ZPR1-domain-containing protein [Pisolithus croceorrhizus]|nr:zf-ZPR1-domain-containing protein [Pisolithus croceorrhizus]